MTPPAREMRERNPRALREGARIPRPVPSVRTYVRTLSICTLRWRDQVLATPQVRHP